MKVKRIPLLIVIAMWIVVIGVMMLPEVDGGYGVDHPEFPTMKHGGSGTARHDAPLLWYGWAFGALVFLLVVSLVAFGAAKKERLRGFGPWLLAEAVVLVGVWSWLVVAYRGYMTETTHELYGGFPAPTAIMFYCLFPCMIMLNVMLVSGFKRWMLSDLDYAEYERLLEDRRRSESGGDADAAHAAAHAAASPGHGVD
jgi:hypothetical protein